MNTTSNPTSYVGEMRLLFERYLEQFETDRERLIILEQQLYGTAENSLCDRKTLPGHLTGAALLFDSDQTHVLLIKHIFLDRWLQPGGHLETSELPYIGARRELNEEVGVLNAHLHPWHFAQGQQLAKTYSEVEIDSRRRSPGVPLDIDSHPIPENLKKNEPPHLHHDWLYLFVLDGDGDVRIQDSEVSNYKWVPVGDLRTWQELDNDCVAPIKS